MRSSASPLDLSITADTGTAELFFALWMKSPFMYSDPRGLVEISYAWLYEDSHGVAGVFLDALSAVRPLLVGAIILRRNKTKACDKAAN